MHIDHSQVKYDAYQKHQVFELIDHMMDYYEGISDTSFSFIPNGSELEIRWTNDAGTALLRCDFADSSFSVLIADPDGKERFRFAQ